MSGRSRDELQGEDVANGAIDYGNREPGQNGVDGILGRRLGIGRGGAMGGQGDAIVFHGKEGNGHVSRAGLDSSQRSGQVGGGDEVGEEEQGRVDLRSFYFRRE